MVRTHGDDASEQKVIDDVRQFGWHIVGIEGDSEGPAFAYSIGLRHTLNHPEIIIFGLKDPRTMMQIINHIGGEVRKGVRFQDWQESDQILEGYPCIFRSVPVDAFPDYLGYALWYYKPDQFPVLQCVWPDRNHHFPWHPDFELELRERQPILANQSDWPFFEGKNRVAFTTNRVVDGSQPIRHVGHDTDGNWQFLCGTTTSPADGMLVCLSTIVDLDASAAELADLPEGWQATRESAKAPWRRMKAEIEE